jgi:hypothetical protein
MPAQLTVLHSVGCHRKVTKSLEDNLRPTQLLYLRNKVKRTTTNESSYPLAAAVYAYGCTTISMMRRGSGPRMASS